MNLDEIMEHLDELGIKITERQFLRYVEEGLVPKPIKKYPGRGKGSVSIYPDETVAEFFASWRMVNNYGIKKFLVKEVREISLMAEKENDEYKIRDIWADAIKASVSSPEERKNYLRFVEMWSDLKNNLKPVVTVKSDMGPAKGKAKDEKKVRKNENA